MKKFNDRLKDLREDNDLTQVNIGRLINKRQQQYSKYETGESEPPLGILSLLADYYNVSIDYIVGRTACKEGVAVLNNKIMPGISVGSLISDIMKLSEAGRASVIDYIALRGLKELCKCRSN
jgi:transcriptional regulator with XRE-family HTH domain